MFLARRPRLHVIDRFLRESQDLPLSYGPIGIVRTRPEGFDVDEVTVAIGQGQADLSGHEPRSWRGSSSTSNGSKPFRVRHRSRWALSWPC